MKCFKSLHLPLLRRFTFLICLLTTISFAAPTNTQAAFQPLQIFAPRAAGTGSPAIPATHRIFYAYPGLEYKIRAQVVGGDYPYAFQLSNAPAGMTIDAQGYIRWTNPQSNANNIGLRVTDSLGAFVDTTWSITVSQSGFKFVNCTAGSNGNGSEGSPYNSIENMTSAAATDDIIYFRNGTCTVPIRGNDTLSATIGGTSNSYGFVWGAAPSRWLAYPGESPTIDLTGNRFFSGSGARSFYFEGLRFYRGLEFFFRPGSNQTYVTFLDNTFDTLTINRTSNGNQGGYFTQHNGTGYYLTFQGNTFYGFREALGIGSLYNQTSLLVENNHISDHAGLNAFGFKTGIAKLTLRGNVTEGVTPLGSTYNAYFGDGRADNPSFGPMSNQIEILYNHFYRPGGLFWINSTSAERGVFWIHRNTFHIGTLFANANAATCNGPWFINNNAWQGSTAGITDDHWTNTDSTTWQDCVDEYLGNVVATTGVFDVDGLLTPAYSASVGSLGWQFPDGSTPMDGIFVATPDETLADPPQSEPVLPPKDLFIFVQE